MAKAANERLRARKLLLDALKMPETLPALPLADWELLLRVARRARVLGRMESALHHAGLLGDIPPRAAAHLRAARNVIAHRKTLISWEVNRLLWALKGIDAPLILLKGTAYLLADLPPARGRIFADVDLLVPEDRVMEIEERLVERGWFKTEIDPYDDRYYRVWMHEIPPLRHRERGTEIDIHHRLLPKTSHLASDPAPLFAAARPLADPRLHVLAPADMILHALVHLFLEGDPDEGLRLRDLADVHDLLCHHAQEPAFWASLVPRARALGFQRPLFYGLHHAHQLFGTPIPPDVLRELEDAAPAWPIRKLMNRLIPLALLPGHPDHPSRLAALARWLIYVRAHWLRMPPGLLIKHLSHKAWLRLRGFRKRVDLAQLDLKEHSSRKEQAATKAGHNVILQINTVITMSTALPPYVELHCCSNFSFLRGASHPEELVEQAQELGYSALAITDEASLAGVVRAHRAASARGLQLIIGAEFRLCSEPGKNLRLVLLAQNRAGYGNLSALITLARRRSRKGQYRLYRGDLESPGDFAGSSGALPDCLALWIPDPGAGVDEGRWLATRFPARSWLAVELHAGPDDATRLAMLLELATASGLPAVAAGDVHMHRRSRRPLQDTLTAIRLKSTLFSAGHALFANGERHLRSRLRLARLYPPELLTETLSIAARCAFSLAELRYEYPDEVVPAGHTASGFLRAEVEKGLRRRYPDGEAAAVRERVEHELALIGELAYEPYS